MNLSNLYNKTNPELFRERIHNFDGLIKYTKKLLDSDVEYELYDNGNIATSKICYHAPTYDTFYISEITEDKINSEVLFWEKKEDRLNYFSSAGKLSRLVRKLFIESNKAKDNGRWNDRKVQNIQNKINNLIKK